MLEQKRIVKLDDTHLRRIGKLYEILNPTNQLKIITTDIDKTEYELSILEAELDELSHPEATSSTSQSSNSAITSSNSNSSLTTPGFERTDKKT